MFHNRWDTTEIISENLNKQSENKFNTDNTFIDYFTLVENSHVNDYYNGKTSHYFYQFFQGDNEEESKYNNIDEESKSEQKIKNDEIELLVEDIQNVDTTNYQN